VRVLIAVALALVAWPTFSWSAYTYTFNYEPTPLEVSWHHGCSGPVKYLECLAGGRQVSAGSEFLSIEHHQDCSGLTADDIAEVQANGNRYGCDPATLSKR
jgi:hypothetical protein